MLPQVHKLVPIEHAQQALGLSFGQASDAGVKAVNQDCVGYRMPDMDTPCFAKGAVFAIADGISSSTVSQIASDHAIAGFLEQYYYTPDSWGVIESAHAVIQLLNTELHLRNQNSPFQYNLDKGYVCTFSAIVIKHNIAYLFHTGDAQIRLFRNGEWLLQTKQHRVAKADPQSSYLQHALGISEHAHVDISTITLRENDLLYMATDGIYEFITDDAVRQLITQANNLQHAANAILNTALHEGSNDNLSVQVVRIAGLGTYSDAFPPFDAASSTYPALPWANCNALKEGEVFDGYSIVREIYQSNRSHIYLASDSNTHQQVIIKIPSIDQYEDNVYMHGFALEEWVSRRINSPFVVKSPFSCRQRQFRYVVQEYVKGQTLAQWIIDNPKPSLETVRHIVEQIGAGLIAMHSHGVLHQDLRPENIMIDETNTVKIIDLGAARVLGLTDILPQQHDRIMGSMLYSAPEYFLGELGTEQSDLYSLAVISYFMLSGQYPYGTKIARYNTLRSQQKLRYISIMHDSKPIPQWFDLTLRQATQLLPAKRTQTISQYLYDIRHPNVSFLNRAKAPLIERYPNRVWQITTLILAISNILLLVFLS